jgi:3',5'-cyclic AMP phosphodiesterase CpdA
MRIAHLADLHVWSKYRPHSLDKVRRLIEAALDEGADHVVITGDLTHDADRDDFQGLRNLFHQYGLLNPEKLTIVIGNHDIFGGVHFFEEAFHFPNRCQNTDYLKKVIEFKEYFRETYEECYFPLLGRTYPFGKHIGDTLFIGMNSIANYSKVNNLFASKGKIYKKQRIGLEMILRKYRHAPKKIVLMHHHFNKNKHKHEEKIRGLIQNIENEAGKLRKKKKLLDIFKKHGVKLVLHGHLHESVSYQINNIHFVNAGGSVDKNQKGELRVNLIDVVDENVTIDIRTLYKQIDMPKPHQVLASEVCV